jgi:hypothetical protein
VYIREIRGWFLYAPISIYLRLNSIAGASVLSH